MNWLKVITKSGRQALARELLQEYVTPQKVAEYAASGVNSLLSKVNDKTILARTAVAVNNAATFTANLAEAVRDGTVTPDEAAALAASAQATVETFVTKEAVAALIDKAIALVP